MNDMDERKTWSFIKSLNGSPENNSPNEVLKHNGKKNNISKKNAEFFFIGFLAGPVSVKKFHQVETNTSRYNFATTILRPTQVILTACSVK